MNNNPDGRNQINGQPHTYLKAAQISQRLGIHLTAANFYTTPRMTSDIDLVIELSEMEERYRAMLLKRTGEERLIMGCVMRDTARAMVEASLRAQDPNATVETIRKGVFLRFYGHEFDQETCARVLVAIESAAHSVTR